MGHEFDIVSILARICVLPLIFFSLNVKLKDVGEC